MSEREVIKMVTGQLQHDFATYERISTDSKNKCIRMIMDFLDMKKADAVELMNTKVIPKLKLYSGEFSGMTYKNDGCAIFLEVPNEGIKVNIYKENLLALSKELKKLLKSFEVLEKKDDKNNN
jgi:hypothetical protein